MNIVNFRKIQWALNYSVSPNHSKQQAAAEDIHADDVSRIMMLLNSLSHSLGTPLSHSGTPGWLNWKGGFFSCFCSFAHCRKILRAQPFISVSPQTFPTSLSLFWWGLLMGKREELISDTFLGTSVVEKTPVLVKYLVPECRWNVISDPELTVSFEEDQLIILDFQSAPWIFKAVKGVGTNKSASFFLRHLHLSPWS